MEFYALSTSTVISGRERQTDRRTERQRQTDKQRDRQTDGQKDKDRQTNRDGDTGVRGS